MGCDIHLFGERKVDGAWTPIKGESSHAKFWRDRVNRHTEQLKTGNIPARCTEDELRQEIAFCQKHLDYYVNQGDVMGCLYGDRNYDVFAILANVRNGRGFAGIKTGEGFNPISEPKGLPDDVSAEIKQESDEWGEDGHSHSWLTLRELLEYDWNQRTGKTGVVSEEEYKVFKENGEPDSWSGDVSGNSIVRVTNKQMDAIISGNMSREEGKKYFTQIVWGTTYMERAQWFYNAVIPKMQELYGNEPDNVRIVFWFDN